MKQIQIISSTNFQNEKIEDHIEILGRSFRYSDNRGFGTHVIIDWDFALEIMDQVPARVHHAQRVLDLLNKEIEIRLTWDHLVPTHRDREAGMHSTYGLRIHAGSEHLYTSIPQ